MSKKVGNIFEANSKCLIELAQALDTGYRIPEYQRPYDWAETNVKRLYTDCLRGFYRLGNGTGTSAFCFLGSLILVDEKSNEPSFPGRSVAVIDGQQRLTTLSLMSCALHSQLNDLDLDQLNYSNKKILNWLKQERENFLIDLSRVALGGLQQRGGSISFFPRIVRASYNDNRATNLAQSEYNSPIAKFLNQFAGDCQNKVQFSPPVLPNTRAGNQVKANFLLLRDFIANINNLESYDDYDATIVPKNSFKRPAYKDLFSTLRDHFDDDISETDKAISKLIKNDKVANATRFILFCSYFLSNVILTTIIAQDEALAFDMFDSLNTTGQPLTALETLKPLVISYENNKPKKYNGSDAKRYFAEMQDILDIPNLTTSQKQKLTRDAITNSVLLTAGEKLGHETSDQRAKLRSHFDKAVAKGETEARAYVKNIRNVIIFRDAYWQSDYEKLAQFHPAIYLKEIKFLMAIINGLKTHLALPILQRYWTPDIKQKDQLEFLAVARAVVAFLLLRRGFTGSTAGIDSEFRKLMSIDLNSDPSMPAAYLKTGIDKQFRRPSSMELRSGLLDRLRKGTHKFSKKENWVKKASLNPLYDQSGVLCKALHLFAADQSKPDHNELGHWLRKGIKSSSDLCRADYATWIHETVKTVEHIAPKVPKNTKDWDQEIYNTPGLIHCLGNLTLLPTNMNTRISNTGWQRKSKFFAAIACEKDAEQKLLFEEAKADGIEFKKEFLDIIEKGEHLPLVVPVSQLKSWDSNQIKLRAENIASLAYDKLFPWLK